MSVTPVYLVEVSSLDNRGMLGVVPPLFTQIGVLYTYIVGVYVDWRLLSLTGVSLGLIFILCVWFIPESPLYLASKAKFEAAEASLEWLGRKSDSVKFFKEVQTDMNVFDVTLAKSWRQYIDPRVYKPFLTCLSLMFFFQVGLLKKKLSVKLSNVVIYLPISGYGIQHHHCILPEHLP